MGQRKSANQKLTSGLGWFSIGLGLAEILAPKRVSELAGIEPQPTLIRCLGAREIGTGIGLLTQPQNRSGWLWARVAGDLMDLAVLGAAPKTRKSNFALACATVAGVTALDVYATVQAGQQQAIHVKKTITIDRSPEDLFNYWRNFEQLTTFMRHFKSVERTGENRWHCVANAPAGTSVQWDAEIINEIPNELIAWRTLPGSDIEQAGTVRFERATGGRGTVVKVDVVYHLPGGAVGNLIAKVYGEAPEQQIGVELRRFKQLMETGEIARTEGQSSGRPNSTSKVYDDMVRA